MPPHLEVGPVVDDGGDGGRRWRANQRSGRLKGEERGREWVGRWVVGWLRVEIEFGLEEANDVDMC